MRNGESINPDPPPSPFIFDSMVEKDPEDVVHHFRYLLFLWVLGVDISEGEHPVLPHRALQQAADTNTKKGYMSCLVAYDLWQNNHL